MSYKTLESLGEIKLMMKFYLQWATKVLRHLAVKFDFRASCKHFPFLILCKLWRFLLYFQAIARLFLQEPLNVWPE